MDPPLALNVSIQARLPLKSLPSSYPCMKFVIASASLRYGLSTSRPTSTRPSSTLSPLSSHRIERSARAHASPRILRRRLSTANDYAHPFFAPLDTFADRHVGPRADQAQSMLRVLGYTSMDAFIDATVPNHIRIPAVAVSDETIQPLTESEMLQRAKQLAAANSLFRSYIGMGYHNAVVPPVILRNVSPTRFVLLATTSLI